MSIITSFVEVSPNPDLLPHFQEFQVVAKRITGVQFGVTFVLIGNALFRLLCNGRQIFPLNGYITLLAGANLSGYYGVIPVSIVLEGPPYALTLEYVALSGAETGKIGVLILSTDDPDPEQAQIENLEKIIGILGG